MFDFRILLIGTFFPLSLIQATIELNDQSIEFSNCTFAVDIICESNNLGSCVVSSFSAACTDASCETPKKIVGQLDSAMPDCTQFSVQVGDPTTSSSSSWQRLPKARFMGENQCLQDISDGTAKDLITCIITPFDDSDIDITYVFSASLCVAPQIFQRTFTLSLMDQSVLECCDVCPAFCP